MKVTMIINVKSISNVSENVFWKSFSYERTKTEVLKPILDQRCLKFHYLLINNYQYFVANNRFIVKGIKTIFSQSYSSSKVWPISTI